MEAALADIEGHDLLILKGFFSCTLMGLGYESGVGLSRSIGLVRVANGKDLSR
jgi:hypothetical protein